MNYNLPIDKNAQIGFQILAYLAEHPEAQDTLEGIVEWWLLERQIKFQSDRVQAALSELVSQGLILEKKGPDLQKRYGINQAIYKNIQVFLDQQDE